MFHPSRRLGRTAAILAAAGSLAIAADGGLTLTVTDAQGLPVAGAAVTLTSPTQIGGARKQATDEAGKARFIRLSPGHFKAVVTSEAFQTAVLPSLAVTVDQTALGAVRLVPRASAVVEVFGTASALDVTTVTQGTQFTQEFLESLPLGRSQTDVIALTPGVISVGGDPSLAAGLNRDNYGHNGARNNTYLIDGIDVTSPETGTLRTGIAPELIQVQDVKTGAITAEYSARAGLFSSVTTKAGGNEFTGGATVAYSPGSLQAAPAPGRFQVGSNNVVDTTVWVSGPVLKDKLWYVASYQYLKDTVDVDLAPTATAKPGEVRTGTQYQGFRLFAKLTYQPTASDTLDFTFNNNPSHSDNLNDPTLLTQRAVRTDQGGKRYLAHYGREFGNLYLDVRASRHEERNDSSPLSTKDGPENDILSLSPLSPLQAQIGGSGVLDQRTYRKDLLRVDGTYIFDLAGGHTLKGGYQQGREQLTVGTGVGLGDAYQSYDSPAYTWGDVPPSYIIPPRVLTAVNNSSSLTGQFVAAGFKPTGHDPVTGRSTFQLTDLANYTFAEANPLGGYYGYRLHQQSFAQSTPSQTNRGFYVQDQWQAGRLTLSPGFRFDSYRFLADNGQEMFNTGFTFAPRAGLSYDVKGDGRSKVYAFFGRYIDPIKLDIINFTGNLNSSVRTQDVRLFGQWVTFNVRGGASTLNAVFADGFKLPKTDEFRLGYSTEFATNYVLDASLTRRRDYDLVEDWDPTQYTDANALESEARTVFNLGQGAVANPLAQSIISRYRALVLDPGYFAGGGFTGAQNIARVKAGKLNYILANLPGGERIYRTIDLSLRRKEADHWGGLASLSLVEAKGNSNSSGNADVQGDLAQYDPRLPYNNGHLEGSVDWVLKGNGYYHWDNGLLVGATFNARAGYHYSRSEVRYTRTLLSAPTLQEAFAEQLGSRTTPAFNQWDLRVQYAPHFQGRVQGEVFLDVLNALNRQEPTGLAEGVNVRAGVLPDQPYSYQAPRRLNAGIRIKF
jgi:hypothetical protein